MLRLTTYERLGEYLTAFAKGHFHLMILVGTGGLAKSRSVRAVLGDKGCWIEDNATPFGMYAKLYRHRDEFVVIDDVDALYADRSGVRLLKCLCQTEDEKTVAWHSDARSLERQRIPREFTTRSRVVIISNDWQTLNKNVAALQDRGHVLLFQPSASEVHAQAGKRVFRESLSRGQVRWRPIYEKRDEDGGIIDQFSVSEEPALSAEGYRLVWYHTAIRKYSNRDAEGDSLRIYGL